MFVGLSQLKMLESFFSNDEQEKKDQKVYSNILLGLIYEWVLRSRFCQVPITNLYGHFVSCPLPGY